MRAAGVLIGALAVAAPTSAAAQDSTHTQTVSGTSATYSIGSIEGTALPINRSVKIENLGAVPITQGKLIANGRDWSTIDKILEQIIRDGMSSEEKARAIWQFVSWERYASVSATVQTRDPNDPVKLLNGYGYGLCTETHLAMAALFERVGMPTRFWVLGGGRHDVVEVWHDMAWHLYDADTYSLFLLRDNKTVAGVRDLIADPGLIERAGPDFAFLIEIFTDTDPESYGTTGHRIQKGHEIAWTLQPGASVEMQFQGTGRIHNDTGITPYPMPKLYGTGVITSRFDAADALHTAVGTRDQLTASTNAAGPVLVPASASQAGSFNYRLDSPYPIADGSLVLDVTRESATDQIRVYVNRHTDHTALLTPDIVSGHHRRMSTFVSETNIITVAEDGNWPALHAQYGQTPATLIYELRPDPTADRIGVGGWFYRLSVLDDVALSVSTDGTVWQRVWEATDEVGSFEQLVDVTDLVDGHASFFVRYELVGATVGYSGPGQGWTAGVHELRMKGVEPPDDELVWELTGGTPEGRVSIPVSLSSIVGADSRSPLYSYRVRVELTSAQSPATLGLHGFELATKIQVAPKALPTLLLGQNTLVWTQTSAAAQVRLTHVWQPVTGLRMPDPPRAPFSPIDGGGILPGAPFTLSWLPGAETGGPIIRYRIQICADAACASPFSTVFDKRVDVVDPATDGTTYQVKEHDWFIEGRTYYWRVKVQNEAALWSDYSQVWQFTIGLPPTLSVISPRSTSFTYTAPYLLVRGISADAHAIEWETHDGVSGVADGVESWRANVPVVPGENRVLIIATGTNGIRAAQELVINVEEFVYHVAEGATGPFFDFDLLIANPGAQAAPVTIDFLTDDGVVVPHALTVPAHSRRTIRVDELPGLESVAASAVVHSPEALPLLVERTARWGEQGYGGHGAAAVHAPGRRWYFAEGAQGWFNTYYLVANAQTTSVEVTFTFFLEPTGTVTRTYVAEPTSRLTVDTTTIPELIDRSFAVQIDATLPVVAERAMYFGTDQFWTGGHGTAGAREQASQWFLAEGATGSFFETFILLANPNPQTVSATCTFLLEDGTTIERTYPLPGSSRLTINPEQEDPALAEASLSTTISATGPIVVERTMYWPGAPASWQESHGSFGLTGLGPRWGLAEGRIGGVEGYATYVLVANPDPVQTSELQVTFLPESGAPVVRTTTVGPKSRRTLSVAELAPELADSRFGVVVETTNDVPIAVERAMYWDAQGAMWSGGTGVTAIPLP